MYLLFNYNNFIFLRPKKSIKKKGEKEKDMEGIWKIKGERNGGYGLWRERKQEERE